MRKRIGKKTTFQLTTEQKAILLKAAEQLAVPEAALIRGLIRYKKEKDYVHR